VAKNDFLVGMVGRAIFGAPMENGYLNVIQVNCLLLEHAIRA
jgi:hypothetical protein